VAVRVVIQHHPDRWRLLDRVIASCADMHPTAVIDPDPTGRPSAWRTYRRCLEGPHGTSHVLILQDDAVCQPGFATAAVTAAEEKPDALISFFHSKFPNNARMFTWRAMDAGEPFWSIPRGRFIPTVALLWPTKHIEPFLTWVDTIKKLRPDFLGDDSVVGDWVNRSGVEALQTAPSLVEHPDDVPSQCRKRVSKRHAIELVSHCDDWTKLLRSANTAATVATAS
jgi:hypothetical protein